MALPQIHNHDLVDCDYSCSVPNHNLVEVTMKKPKILLNLLYGVVVVILFLGIGLVISNFLPFLVSLLWVAIGLGLFVGLKIHLLRRFSWLEYLDKGVGQ